jgi:hypothetical protein
MGLPTLTAAIAFLLRLPEKLTFQDFVVFGFVWGRHGD